MAGRLRVGEWLAALGAALMLVALLELHWYRDPARTGWTAIPTLRWFVLVTAALGLALALAQASRPGPALAVTLDMIATVVGGLTTLLLAIRLITTGASVAVGGYVGLVAAAVTVLGAFRAFRAEQGWTPGPERPVELVELSSAPSR